MIDKDAIITLQASDIARGILAATDGRYTIIPDTHRLVSLDEFHDTPARFKGTFKTEYIEDFVRYVNDNIQKHSVLFIDTIEEKAKVIIDHGTVSAPKHGEHTCLLELFSSPEYQALKYINNRTHDQRQFIAWLEEWSDNIIAYDSDGKQISIAQAISSIRKIQIHKNNQQELEEGEECRKLSNIEKIETKMLGKRLKKVLFTFTPYESFPEMTAEIRIKLIPLDKGFSIHTIGSKMGTIKQRIHNEFKNILKSQIKDICVYIGSFGKINVEK